eukprot:1416538-Prymnesium_polylepis.1
MLRKCKERREGTRGRAGFAAAHLHHEQCTLRAAAVDGEAAERREADLRLRGVLREPLQIGAAVGEALLDLEQHARLRAHRVLHRHVPVGRRRHERIFDPARARVDAVALASPEGRRQHAARRAVDFGRCHQLCELAQRCVDQVERRRVDVAQAARLPPATQHRRRLSGLAAQHRIVLDKHGPRVEPPGVKLHLRER